MFYNFTAAVRYKDGLLGVVDCPLPSPDGVVRLGAAALPSAFVRLTNTAFAGFHFDVPIDPGVKIALLNRCSAALRQIDFTAITSINDIAARCSGQLAALIPANEVQTLPVFGIMVVGLSTSPVRDFGIVGLHSYRRDAANRPFTVPMNFPGNVFGGMVPLIAQFLDAKVFSRYFDRVHALRFVYLMHAMSYRALGIQGLIAPELSIVEVSETTDFTEVPRSDLTTARSAAATVFQKIDLACKALGGGPAV
jgi:hypothetical protein